MTVGHGSEKGDESAESGRRDGRERVCEPTGAEMKTVEALKRVKAS